MNKNVVITGANRGIGLALAKCFEEQGDNVYALCREPSNELYALSVNIIEHVDVTTSKGLKTMSTALSGIGIDVLICNAGILRDESLINMNIDTIREQFEVNALAPLRVVDALQCYLNPKGKIAMITSRMGSIKDNTSGGKYGYRMSKAALNAASKSLSHDLLAQEISVGVYHPGFVQTDMVDNSGDISSKVAAERITHLINDLTPSESGVFKHSNGEILPW